MTNEPVAISLSGIRFSSRAPNVYAVKGATRPVCIISSPLTYTSNALEIFHSPAPGPTARAAPSRAAGTTPRAGSTGKNTVERREDRTAPIANRRIRPRIGGVVAVVNQPGRRQIGGLAQVGGVETLCMQPARAAASSAMAECNRGQSREERRTGIKLVSSAFAPKTTIPPRQSHKESMPLDESRPCPGDGPERLESRPVGKRATEAQ